MFAEDLSVISLTPACSINLLYCPLNKKTAITLKRKTIANPH